MTIFEFYEKIGTSELKRLLEMYEKMLSSNEKKINIDDEISDILKKENIDHEIDISLIRTELNRRLYE